MGALTGKGLKTAAAHGIFEGSKVVLKFLLSQE